MAELQEKQKKGGKISLFRIAGIQVSLDYSWFFIFFLIFWSLTSGYFPRIYPGASVYDYMLVGFLASLLFFCSVLAHELSHSFMAMRLGIHIPEITLFLFGGVSKLQEDAKDPPTEFKIAVVGPLCSFALAGVFYLAASALTGTGPPGLGTAMFLYLAWINVVLGLFNIMPGFPLDGGRIFRAFWWWKTGSLIGATRVASRLGKAFALGLIVLGALDIFAGSLIGGLWLILIGFFLRGMAEAGYQELVVKQSLSDVPVRRVMLEEVYSVPPDALVGEIMRQFFLKYCYRAFPVMQNGEVLGLLSLEDLKGMVPEEIDGKTVRDVMRPVDESLLTTPETPLIEALRKMSENGAGRLFVMENGRMTGMVTRGSLMRFLEIKNIVTAAVPEKAA